MWWRYWLLWLSLMQSIWTAQFPSEEYKGQFPDTETDFDVTPPKAQPLQDESEEHQALGDYQTDNFSELLFQDEHQSGLLSDTQQTTIVDHFLEENKNSKDMVLESNLTESAVQENNTAVKRTKAIVSGIFLINPVTANPLQETMVQGSSIEEPRTSVAYDSQADTEAPAQDVHTTLEPSFRRTNITEIEKSTQHQDIVQMTTIAVIRKQQYSTETGTLTEAKSSNIEEQEIGSTADFEEGFTTLPYTTEHISAGDDRRTSETISSDGIFNLSEGREEKQGSINSSSENISTSSYQKTTQLTTNGELYEQQNEATQPGATTCLPGFGCRVSGDIQASEELQEVTEFSAKHKSVSLHSTVSSDVETNSKATHIVDPVIATTLVYDSAHNVRSTGSDFIKNVSETITSLFPNISSQENITKNIGNVFTQSRPAEDQLSTASIETSANNETIIDVESEDTVIKSLNMTTNTTITNQANVAKSTTTITPHEARSIFTTTKEQTVINDAIFLTTIEETKLQSVGIVTPAEYSTGLAEDSTTPTTATIPNVITTSYPTSFTTPPSAPISTPTPTASLIRINATNNIHKELLQSCNNETHCSNNEVCVSQTEGCICVSTWKLSENALPCNNSNDHQTNCNNYANNCTVSNDNSMHIFVAKKWNHLNDIEKKYKTISISFSPAPEIIEWFQFYDLKFRKSISAVVAKCTLDKKLNEDNKYLEVSPSDIVYISPTPLKEDSIITLSFFVLYPGMSTNTSGFFENQLIVPCLQEKQLDIQAEIELTVKAISAGYPSDVLHECTFAVACLSGKRVQYLLVGLVIVLSVVICCLVLVAVRRRPTRPRYNGRPFYTARDLRQLIAQPHLNVLRSPGDGHNLASDEQCQQGEGRRRDPENGDVLGKEDSDGWVVPLEDVEPMKQEEKSKEEDSKV